MDAINVGPSPSLGSGHAGNDSTVTRNVYFNNGQDRVNGTYPIGTIIAKRSTNPAGTVDEIVGMAKEEMDLIQLRKLGVVHVKCKWHYCG
ncbi:MAG: hypothetical protein IPN13_14865 [Bacteroidetes bacterium]|nr:hypothetical protein [Bacteroidota bacterium]